MSLNLAQAVMVLAYEWWTAAEPTPPRVLMTNETRIATKAELENFLTHLIDQLDACGFLRNLPKRPGMVRNIRHFFQRGEVTEQELRTLHGIVTELAIGRRQMGRLEQATDAATERSDATDRTAADPDPALPARRGSR
jgi:tRNA C32,U32 (ribose-2'-O)-methylase TrmJ